MLNRPTAGLGFGLFWGLGLKFRFIKTIAYSVTSIGAGSGRFAYSVLDLLLKTIAYSVTSAPIQADSSDSAISVTLRTGN